MSYQMSSFQNLCATCNFWIGPRMPNTWGNAVILDDQSVKGKCWCLRGPHARADRYSNSSTCHCYQKWAVIQQ